MARSIRRGADDHRRQERLADLRQGNRDGRRRQPTLTDVAPHGQPVAVEQLFAPYPDALAYAGRSTMENEFVAYRRRTSAVIDERARLNQQILAGQESVRRNRGLVVAAERPLTAAELTPRNPAESGRDAEWLRRRREVMRSRRIARAESDLAGSILALDALRARRATACQVLDRELDASRASARRVGELVAERVALYWQGVVATHPEGRHLSTVLPTFAPELPDWVTASSRCGHLLLPGEPGPDHDHDNDNDTGHDSDADHDNDADGDPDGSGDDDRDEARS